MNSHITWLRNEETRKWAAVVSDHVLSESEMGRAIDDVAAGRAEPGAIWIVRVGALDEPPELRPYLEAKARRLRVQL